MPGQRLPRPPEGDHGRGRAVLVGGVALAVLGLALIPLPGPGLLLLGLALPVLVVGVILAVPGRSQF